MTCCDERNVLRRAGHLSKLAWELPLTADWYLHLYADPCYLSRPAARPDTPFSQARWHAGSAGRFGGPVITA